MGDSKSGIPFRCGVNASLCFSPQSSCALDQYGQEYCVCPEGLQFDFAGARLSNCTMPTWFYPTFFAISTVGTIYGVAVLGNDILKTKSSCKLRWIAISYTATIVLVWIHVLCVFVENGLYEAGIIFMALYSMSINLAAYLAMITVVEPLYVALRVSIKRLEFWSRVYFMALTIILAGLQLSLLGYARRPDQIGTFNAMFAGQYLVLGISYPVTTTIVYRCATSVKDKVESLGVPKDLKIQKFLDQVNALRTLVRLIGLGGALVMAVSITIFILHSCPYQYLFWAFFTSFYWPPARIGSRFIRSKESNDKQVEEEFMKQTSKDQQQLVKTNPQWHSGQTLTLDTPIL
jgi:hypothetical protein